MADEKQVLYAIHSVVRGRANRTLRASTPGSSALKQYLFGNKYRLVRGRPVKVTKQEVLANLPELKQKAKLGLVELRTMSGAKVDLETMVAEPERKPAPMPNVRLDSVNNDKPIGQPMPKYPGGAAMGDPAAQRAAAKLVKSEDEDESEDED